MTLAYRGTAYHGWQVQQNALSVCTVFQDGVERVLGRRYEVKGCSRTDAGVHANGFVLSGHPLRCPSKGAEQLPSPGHRRSGLPGRPAGFPPPVRLHREAVPL